MFDILVVLADLARLAGGVWGVRRGPKPAFLFWNLWRWRYGMCSAVCSSQGAFLDFCLIHYKDQQDVLTHTWMAPYRHLPAGGHISIQCLQTHTHLHACQCSPLSFISTGLFIMTCVAADWSTYGQMDISHLCSCAMQWSPQGSSSWDLCTPLQSIDTAFLKKTHLFTMIIYVKCMDIVSNECVCSWLPVLWWLTCWSGMCIDGTEFRVQMVSDCNLLRNHLSSHLQG